MKVVISYKNDYIKEAINLIVNCAYYKNGNGYDYPREITLEILSVERIDWDRTYDYTDVMTRFASRLDFDLWSDITDKVYETITRG